MQEGHERYASLLLEWVDRHADWMPATSLPSEPARAVEVDLEEAGTFVTNAALAYVVSRKAEYLELTRRWAMKMCEVAEEHPDNYALGLYVAGLARAYDWLHSDLAEAERVRLRETIARIAESMYLGSFRNAPEARWWAGAHLHHDHWVATAGYGEAALAIMGEVEGAVDWALRAMAEFRTAFSWLGDDGAWHEGPADWCYAVTVLLWFLGAWQSATVNDPHDFPWLRNTSLYRLYHWLPDDTYIYTNDSFRSGRYNTSGSASCHVLRRLASLFGDGHAQWLAERDEAFDLNPGSGGVYQAAYEGSSLFRGWEEYPHSDAFCAAWNLLWFDPDVNPITPDDLPTARHFKNQGVAVLRSGWSAEDSIASFACGPIGGHVAATRIRSGDSQPVSSFTHAHADYNSFTLFAQGRYFVVPSGYARRASTFQNGVTIDGFRMQANPESDPRILAFECLPDFSYVLGDAADAFPSDAGVRRCRRHILMLGSNLTVLFDEVTVDASKRRSWGMFEWAVHTNPEVRSQTIHGLEVVWRYEMHEDGPELRMTVLEPDAFVWEASDITSLNEERIMRKLRLVLPERPSHPVRVLSVWRSGKRSPSPERLSGTGCSAVRIDGQEPPIVVVYRHDATANRSSSVPTYRCPDPHRLLLFGESIGDSLPVPLREGPDVRLIPTVELRPRPSAYLEVMVE